MSLGGGGGEGRQSRGEGRLDGSGGTRKEKRWGEAREAREAHIQTVPAEQHH